MHPNPINDRSHQNQKNQNKAASPKNILKKITDYLISLLLIVSPIAHSIGVTEETDFEKHFDRKTKTFKTKEYDAIVCTLTNSQETACYVIHRSSEGLNLVLQPVALYNSDQDHVGLIAPTRQSQEAETRLTIEDPLASRPLLTEAINRYRAAQVAGNCNAPSLMIFPYEKDNPDSGDDKNKKVPRVNSIIAKNIPNFRKGWIRFYNAASYIWGSREKILAIWGTTWFISSLFTPAYEPKYEQLTAEYNKQPDDPDFTNCEVSIHVETLELYSDMYRHGILSAPYNANTPLATILDELTSRNVTLFQTSGTLVSINTRTANCRCPGCAGSNHDRSIDVDGCYVDVNVQSDILHIELRKRVAYDTSNPVNQFITLTGYFISFDQPTEGEQRENCGCSPCPDTLTDAAVRSANAAVFGTQIATTIGLIVTGIAGYLFYQKCWLKQE